MSDRKPDRTRRKASRPLLDPAEIDALYGLEPVFEPGGGADAALPGAFVVVGCPYCGERFETHADVSAGAQTYIEDCRVCCQPIELSLSTDAQGLLEGVSARRID